MSTACSRASFRATARHGGRAGLALLSALALALAVALGGTATAAGGSAVTSRSVGDGAAATTVSAPDADGESADAARAALAAAARPELSRDGVPERLVLALDGIPFDLFAELQGKQLFAGFRPVARMVAPFPSLSDVSFSAIGGNPPPTGYQVMRFDAQSNRVVGNTLGSLSSRAHSNLPSDSSEYSSWHRMLGYMASSHVAVRELKQVRVDLLASHKATFLAYVETSDAVLHVEGRAGAVRFLRQLDRFLVGLQEDVRARTGRELLVDIVSDHGSTQLRGRNVDIGGQLRSCGLQRSKALAGPTDVAYSFAGIIGFVAVSAQPAQVDTVARCLRGTDGVELVAIERGDRVLVLSADGGEAEILPTPGAGDESYRYRNLRGDPLRLLDASAEPGSHDFPERALFKRTVDAVYPDPLRRLWRAFHGAVQQPSPILLSLADGRDAGFRTVRALAELRGRSGTHGAMTRMASLGVLTSNWRDVDDTDCWRAHELLFGSATLAAMRHRSHGWLSQHASAAPLPATPRAD